MTRRRFEATKNAPAYLHGDNLLKIARAASVGWRQPTSNELGKARRMTRNGAGIEEIRTALWPFICSHTARVWFKRYNIPVISVRAHKGSETSLPKSCRTGIEVDYKP